MKLRKSILVIIPLIIVFNINLFAQVKDIKGWNNCTWGMNKMEVLSLFPSLTVEKNNTLVKNKFFIDSYNFEIVFIFDSLQFKLKKIKLVENGNLKNGSIVYKSIRKKLIEKYGSPIFTEEPKLSAGAEYLNNNFTTLWVFPSSSVELEIVPIHASQKYTLVIIYSEKNTSNKL